MVSPYPLITCICITNQRVELLKRATACFKAQNYPNKELLISYPTKDTLTKKSIDDLISETDIVINQIERPDDMNLGDARNQAVEQSNGIYICTWDDDDWYHPHRLTYQLSYLQQAGDHFHACVINQLILYDQITRKSYLSFLYPWENTLLCKKEVFNRIRYTSLDRGEDSNIIDIVDGDKQLYHIWNSPFLYIYVYHSGNTWGYEHFKSFIKRSEELNHELNENIIRLLK